MVSPTSTPSGLVQIVFPSAYAKISCRIFRMAETSQEVRTRATVNNVCGS